MAEMRERGSRFTVRTVEHFGDVRLQHHCDDITGHL
jgi:hypothetical protein